VEIVLARSSLADVERLLSDRRAFGASGESFVADRDGRTVVPPLRHTLKAGEPIAADAMQRCLQGEAHGFTLEPDYAGVPTAMAYQPLPELGGGCLMVHMSAADIFASSQALRDKMLTLAGLAGVTLIFLGLAIGRIVGRGTEAALQRTRDELERLVHKRTAELEEVNITLEDANRQLVRHTTDLQAVNKELERFSYSVSHDLRAPLRSLDGFSLALLEDCADRLTEQGKDYLNRIRTASQRMGQLIDDLLGLARLARQEFRRKPVNVSELAQSVAADLRQTWPNRQVDLTVAPGLLADADPSLLRVALDKLLGNAWKFTSKQERAVIEVGAMPYEGTTAYFVRDNGAGFDMAYAGKLFGAFQRLHAMTEYPGTGIGLATVQRIVARHGGRVWAEGQVGQGATVYFTLGG
jgi:signal transduction histidine kinase